MKCAICPNQTEGKRKTCSDKCYSALLSKLATERRKAGTGWGDIYIGKSNKAIPNYRNLIK